MLALPFASMIDEWKEKLALEVMPDMTLPVPGYVAYGLMAIGGIFLLVALWRIVTLRIFRGFFALVAALLIAYYPRGVWRALVALQVQRRDEAGARLQRTGKDHDQVPPLRGLGHHGWRPLLRHLALLPDDRRRQEPATRTKRTSTGLRPCRRPCAGRRAPPKPAKDPFDFT